MIDTLCHEYGWQLDYVLYQIPLARAFVLYACCNARYGNDPQGPTYVEEEMINALRQLENQESNYAPSAKTK